MINWFLMQNLLKTKRYTVFVSVTIDVHTDPLNRCILVDETPAEIERPPTETYNKWNSKLMIIYGMKLYKNNQFTQNYCKNKYHLYEM